MEVKWMIVLKTGQDLLLFEQHHHALVSGVMAKHWRSDSFIGGHLREQVEYAVAQHDKAWIPLDQQPLWNEEKQQPYSFVDFPMQEKMLRYQEGVHEVEKKSLYAGLLCSLHYRSFFPELSDDKGIQTFINEEELRQERLINELDGYIEEKEKNFHFDLLQFCDNLSLYCCMNEPGASKARELSWFKDGFPQQFEFAPEGIIANWNGLNNVELNPFPFENSFQVDIPFRQINQGSIKDKGIQQTWNESVLQSRSVTFTSHR